MTILLRCFKLQITGTQEYNKNRLLHLTQAIFYNLLCISLFLCSCCVVAVAAEWLVDVSLSEHHELVALGKSVRMLSRASAFHADGVNLLDVFCDCHEGWHRTERLAEEVCVETCDDDSDTLVGQCLYQIGRAHV